MISPMAKLAIAMAAGWGGSDFHSHLPPVPANRGAGLKVCAKKFKHRNAKKFKHRNAKK